MPSINDKLSEILDVEYTPIDENPTSNSQVIVHENNDSSALSISERDKADIDYVRANYYSLIENGNEALLGILRLAQESQQPRAYEVASAMIKNMSEVTEKLVILQKQRKELQPEESSEHNPNMNIEKAVVYVGTTASLLENIRKHQNVEIENGDE